MSISYLSKVIKGSDFIEPYDTNVVHKALMYKQQKYEQGVEATQQAITSLAGLDVVRNEDKQHLSGLVNNLTGQLNNMSGMDFSQRNVLAQVSQLKNIISNDEKVINAVSSTRQIREFQKSALDLEKKGKYTDANRAYDSQGLSAYMSGKTDTYQGNTFARESKDDKIAKHHLDLSTKISQAKQKGISQISMGNGQLLQIQGVSDYELQSMIENSYPEDLSEQLHINSWYQSRGQTREQLLAKANNVLTNQYQSIKGEQEEYQRAIASTAVGSKERETITNQLNSLTTQYQDKVKGGINTIKDFTDEQLAYYNYIKPLAGSYATGFSNKNMSYKPDMGLLSRMAYDLNVKKFNYSQERDKINDDFKQQEINIDELNAVNKGKGSNSNGNSNDPNNPGFTPVSPVAIKTEADSQINPINSKDLNQQHLDLKNEEFQLFTEHLINQAVAGNRSLLNNPEIVKFLGDGKKSDFKLLDKEGKVNALIRPTIAKWLDKEGYSASINKFNTYMDAIDKGGSPDAFEIDPSFYMLHNKTQGLKAKLKTIDTQLLKGFDEASLKMYDSDNDINKSKVSLEDYKRTVRLFQKVEDTIKEPLMQLSEFRSENANSPYSQYYNEGIKNKNEAVKLLKQKGVTDSEIQQYIRLRPQYTNYNQSDFTKAQDDSLKSLSANTTVQTFPITDLERNKDHPTNAVLKTIIVEEGFSTLNPTKIDGKTKVTIIPNTITEVKLESHTSNNAFSGKGDKATMSITYANPNDPSKQITELVKVDLPSQILNNKSFRGGIYGDNEFNGITKTMMFQNRYQDLKLPFVEKGIKNKNYITYTYIKELDETNPQRLKLHIVMKDKNGNEQNSFDFQGGLTGSAEYLFNSFNNAVRRVEQVKGGITKQEMLNSLKGLQ